MISMYDTTKINTIRGMRESNIENGLLKPLPIGNLPRQPLRSKLTFLRSKERRSVQVASETEVRNNTTDDSQQALDDENPPPPLQTAARPDGRQAAGEQAAKGSRERGSSVEYTDAQGHLPARVQARQVQHHAREQAALGGTQDGADGDEGAVVAHEAQAHGHRAPGAGQGGQPDAGRQPLEDEVGGELAVVSHVVSYLFWGYGIEGSEVIFLVVTLFGLSSIIG